MKIVPMTLGRTLTPLLSERYFLNGPFFEKRKQRVREAKQVQFKAIIIIIICVSQ